MPAVTLLTYVFSFTAILVVVPLVLSVFETSVKRPDLA